MTDKNETVIALLSQPNSGKSTLFNALTGLKQHVGNWPGKTVEQKEGTFEYEGKKYVVADLPGTYSLSANSDEEMITRDYIASGKADVVCILADSSQLERSLYMLSDFAGIEVPCFLILNMSDVAKDQGKLIKPADIESRLGIPVVLFSATDKKDYKPFYTALTAAIEGQTKIKRDGLEAKYKQLPEYVNIKQIIGDLNDEHRSSMWLAVKSVEGDAPGGSVLSHRPGGNLHGLFGSGGKDCFFAHVSSSSLSTGPARRACARSCWTEAPGSR